MVSYRYLTPADDQLSELVAFELWSIWGTPHNYRFWESWVKSSRQSQDIPRTLVALHNGVFVGTVSLWRCDLQSRQDIFPWLGGWFVRPEWRGKGIGTTLLTEACTEARRIGYSELWMFSELPVDFCASGWVPQGYAPNENGRDMPLFKLSLVQR